MSVSLSTILECLNIFGNAGAAAANTFKKEGGYDSDGGGDDAGGGGGGSRWRGKRKRQGAADDDDDEEGDGRYGKRGGRRETAEEGKTTSLRLSYAGHGEPLVMLYVHFLCVPLTTSSHVTDYVRRLEESGIVTRCEITTYEPEGLLDLAFNDEDKIQRLIIKVGSCTTFASLFPSCFVMLTPVMAPCLKNSPTGSTTPSSKSLTRPKNCPSRSPPRMRTRIATVVRNGIDAGSARSGDNGQVRTGSTRMTIAARKRRTTTKTTTMRRRCRCLGWRASDRWAAQRYVRRLTKMMRRRLTWLVPIASLDPRHSIAQMDYSDDKDVLEIFECEQALRNSCVPTVSCFRSEWDDISQVLIEVVV